MTKQFNSLEKRLQRRFLEEYALKQLKEEPSAEGNLFSRLTNDRYHGDLIDFIMKLSTDSFFEELCKQEKYNDLWGEQYSLIGYELCCHQEKKYNFLPHRKNNFDLLRGAYYFHQAQKVKEEMKNDFTLEEIKFLKYAGKFNSVHAQQRYNAYCYQEIKNPTLSFTEKQDLINIAIGNSKQLRQTYGAYGDMMLAEAFFHYADLLRRHEDPVKAEKAIKAALSCCESAKKNISSFPKESELAIHNASLGNGLGFSNSLNIADPQSAQEFLNHYILAQTELDSASEQNRRVFL